MAREKRSTRPTDAELAILRVLWQLGPSTVRQIHRALNEERDEELPAPAVSKR